MKEDILGTKYTIEYRKHDEDTGLKNADGYHDPSINLIVIEDMQQEEGSKKHLENYQKQVLRHEIVHAFLYQSGLDNGSMAYGGPWAQSEEMVVWIAIQAPKLLKSMIRKRGWINEEEWNKSVPIRN